MIGLYIHFPFCEKKCPYCDFYSLVYDEEIANAYVFELCKRLESTNELVDTVYFGGGTPSLLKPKQIEQILSKINKSNDCEITLEANPHSAFLNWDYNPGINRLSMGLQSANENELAKLGRIHTPLDVVNAVNLARSLNIDNISLDLMLGIPSMTFESLEKSIEFCANLNVNHISCYILKIEQGTPFYKNIDSLCLPDEDIVSDMYLFMTQKLESLGYNQYEISNFAKKGFESRHNLKYWNCEEYLALGPSAHLYKDGKRMFFPRDLDRFLKGNAPTFDSYGGDFEEFAMLKLRLSKGLSKNDCEKYPKEKFEALIKKAKTLPKNLITCENDSIKLTKEGFLLSNTILSRIL
ncbi:MAG: radical SAM family heme chaperone HemW [Clostridia bacterium]